jgi:hypothetical protein
MPIKTFRGLMQDDTQDTIVLHTNNGSTGYRIVKFEALGVDANTAYENTIQIWSVAQTTNPSAIDLSNQEVLAAGVFQQTVSGQSSAFDKIVIDNMVFNQDIYITHKGLSAGSGSAINYYIELEQLTLDLNQNTVATLKDIRNITGST